MSCHSLIAGAAYYNALGGASGGPGKGWATATPLNGTSEYTESSVSLSSLGSSYAIAVWTKVATGEAQTTTDNAVFGTTNEGLVYQWGHSAPNRRGIAFARTAGSVYGTSASAPVTIAANTWKHIGVVVNGSAVLSIVDGVQVASSTDALPGFSLTDLIRFGTSSGASGRNLKGDQAGAICLAGGTTADLLELFNGFEPTNTVAPTFNATTGDWTVGTWDSYSNGSLTYTVLLKDDADDSTVATLQTDSASTSGNCLSDLATAGAGTYYIEVVAANDGGDSDAELSATSVYTSNTYDDLTTGASAPTWRLQGDADLNGTGDADAILGPANGSWTGTAAYVDPPTGKGTGKGFSFASSHITIAAADSLRPQSADWSCSFWFKLSSATVNQRVVTTGAQFSTRPNVGFDINSSGNLDVFAANGTTNVDGTRFLFRSAGGIDWTEWHFVSLAFDRTAVRATLRLDGVAMAPLIGTVSGDGVSISGIVPDYAIETRLGGNASGTTQTAVQLYDYRVYDGVALTSEDDAALYAGPTIAAPAMPTLPTRNLACPIHRPIWRP